MRGKFALAAMAMIAVPAAAPARHPAHSCPAQPPRHAAPERVLQCWGKAIEARNWHLVRAYWGQHGAESTQSAPAFAAAWAVLKTPHVIIGKGEGDGAMGSTYFTAPVTIRDGARTLSGNVVLRACNHVPGCTAEDLRWHIYSSEIKP